jgi:hypothetical protein
VNVAQPGSTERKDNIMTSSTISRRQVRTMAGVMLVTAGASVAGMLGAAAPANAADAYIVLAAGDVNDAPPVQTVGGIYIGPDQNTGAALSNCVDNGGHQCVVEVIAKNACAAVASNDYGEFEAGQDPSLQVAQANARQKLQAQQGARIVVSGCSNGAVPPPPPPPPAPAPPKLGPTVNFNPILGGLEAHITDRSGVASQCTYAMDEINRTFALAANSTFDLRIVPAIPRFRDRNVTITCDNGTKTQATTRF